jgi:hypothetical protein
VREHRTGRSNDADGPLSRDYGVSDPLLEALWQKARADFRADDPNRAFIEHCRQSQLLPEAARRYREERDRVDEAAREPIARRLAAIATIAMAQLDAQKREPPKRRTHPAFVILAALVLLLTIYGLVVALRSQ